MSKRQWRKTLNPPVIDVNDPFIEERRHFNLPIVNKIDNKSILREIFNPKYFTIGEAYKQVASYKKLGCAFNNKWFFGSKIRNMDILLFKEALTIGVAKDNGKIIVIPNAAKPLVEQIENMGFRVEIE